MKSTGMMLMSLVLAKICLDFIFMRKRYLRVMICLCCVKRLTNLTAQQVMANRAWALGDSLEHARYLPNRRIEIANIDERMRNLANMMDWMKYLPPIQFEKSQ